METIGCMYLFNKKCKAKLLLELIYKCGFFINVLKVVHRRLIEVCGLIHVLLKTYIYINLQKPVEKAAPTTTGTAG